MKTRIIALFFFLLLATTALAGPNEGVVLTVHANVTGVETSGDDVCSSIPIPATCEETVPGNAMPDENGVEWFVVLAARNEPLDLIEVEFGIGDYQSSTCYIAFYGPCQPNLGPLEIPSVGWPGPQSGTSVRWDGCLEGTLIPVYYFGVYASATGVVPLGDFIPGGVAHVTNCEQPFTEDSIDDFGSFGCRGSLGEQVCPVTSSVPEDDPETADGTTWGQIKALYK